MSDRGAAENTDVVVHVFKESEEPFAPQNTVFVTQFGGIGICLNGHCIVKHPREWHAIASGELPRREPK